MTSNSLILYLAIMILLSLLSRGLLTPFLLVFLIVRAFGITSQDLLFLLRSPGLITGIFYDKRLKLNHALEHATLNILQEKNEKPKNISGGSNRDGFIINGAGDIEAVRAAAAEAIKRIGQGETDLIIHRGCGSTKLALGLIASLLTLGAAIIYLRFLLLTRLGLFVIPACVLIGVLVGYLLNSVAQRYLTTSRHADDVIIDSVEYKNTLDALFRRAPASVFVYIRHLKRIN